MMIAPSAHVSFLSSKGQTCDNHRVARSPAEVPRLYQRLMRDVARERLPEREVRSNPRVVKRKMSSFRLKRAQHAHPPQPTIQSFRDAVHVYCPAEDDQTDLLLDLSDPLDLMVLPRRAVVECSI